MSFCILPWIHLEVRPHGTVHPCCLHRSNNEENDLRKISIHDFWHGDYMNNLRQEFLDGKKPKGCAKCWNVEKANGTSKRMVDNEKFSKHFYKTNNPIENPVYLDLKLGTVCNIKCRTCSTYSSSKWAEDEKLIYGNPLHVSSNKWVEQDSYFWNELELMLDKVEYIDFTGGEPFLIKQHLQILRKCVKQGLAKNISIHYNTNGTIKPTDEMFELWKHFKWVEVMFSIDGLEQQFEYLRYPAKWNEVMSTFKEVKKKDYLHVSVCHTISIFNVYYLSEFLKWFGNQELPKENLYLNLLHNPDYFCIKNLSRNSKKKIIKKLKRVKNLNIDHIIHFINQNGENKDFLQNVAVVDHLRGEDFQQTFSDIYEILK